MDKKKYREQIKRIGGQFKEEKNKQEQSPNCFQWNRSAAFLRIITESIPLIVLAKEAESGIFVFWNKKVEEVTGYRASEVIGKTAFEIFPKEQALAFQQGDREVLEHKQPLEFSAVELKSLTQGKRIMRTLKVPVFIDSKDPLLVVFAQDITDQYEANQEVVKQRAMTRSVLNSVDDQMAVIDPQGNIIVANEAWGEHGKECKLALDHSSGKGIDSGKDYLQVCQRIFSQNLSAAEAEEAKQSLLNVLNGRRRKFTLEYECGAGDLTRYYMMNVSPLRHDKYPGAVVSHIDITEHKKAAVVLQESHNRVEQLVRERTAELQLFEKIFSSALEGMMVTDSGGTIINVNAAFTSITGYSRGQALGRNPRILKSDRQSEAFYQTMWESLKQQGRWEGEIWNRRANGEVYPEWLTINAIKDGEGRVINYAAVFHDISQVKEKEEKIEQLIYQDPLTGLPNRALMFDRLAVALEHARRTESRVAIFYIDLDNFNNINDSLGHPAGDDLLCIIAGHLESYLRNGDTVAHVSGDEFIVISRYEENHSVSHLAERLHRSFDKNFSIGEHEFYVTASIGIATFPEDGTDVYKLLQNATLALHQAKKKGKNCYRLFDEKLNAELLERMTIEQDLRDALKTEDFPVYYQPQINMASGKIIGIEALIRWQKRDGTLVPPDLFIPVAEEIGLIHELGLYVLEKACRDLQQLHAEGFADLHVAVNLSAVQFEKQSMVQDIVTVLQRNNFDPAFLELEVTETIMMSDVEITEMTLNKLAQQGIHLSVDDFGTGYSSLYYLKHFPINTLKIDRSFVRDLMIDSNDRAIVSAILTMAGALNIETVAEGIEDEEQQNFLRRHGCDKGQGYLYSRPLPYDELIALLRTEPANGFTSDYQC